MCFEVQNILIQNMFMNTRTEREKRKKERGVLFAMSVTLIVSHFERSPLNTEAEENTIKKRYQKKSSL